MDVGQVEVTQGWASTDEGAVAEARAGNAEAFRALVERHSRNVYRLAFRMTANPHDAEDMVQETFLRACKQLDKFDGRASFGTWLHRIAANVSLDLIRSRKTREKYTAEMTLRSGDKSDQSWLDRVAAQEPSPERLSLSEETGRLLARAMRKLSSAERSAFVLRHYEGHSIEEIASVLKINPGAAKHCVFRAVQKLRAALEPAV